ncbi:MAG: hypothetical protein KIT11_07810 [Fimbriimonadaceae bacterium]|nr:hypothetical protein [Fimbriimonadaceae bacterium]QYK56260.1 MAG: hypothetical protein KF733_02005 [Fimbriimonadaceae bacterium]
MLALSSVPVATTPGPVKRPPFAAAVENEDPLRLLKRALESQKKVDAVLLQHRLIRRGSPPMFVKVQIVANKGVKVSILQPFSLQGIVSLDDSQEFKSFLPDQKMLVVQTSPTKYSPDVAWRMNLIKRNYQTSFGEDSSVAGRKVRELVMVPKNGAMPVRKLLVDSERDFVLRLVVEPPDQPPVDFYTTRVARFDRAEALRDFNLPPEADDARKVVFDAPRRIQSLEAARKVVGFTPRRPKTLPYGFRESLVHVVGEGEAAHVAFRITDGMASATVYQWRQDRYKGRPPGSRRWQDQDRHGISYSIEAVFGDELPDPVFQGLLQSYLEVQK